MPDGRFPKDRDSPIRHGLVFYRAADDNVRIAVLPVRRNTCRKALDALCDKQEHEVAPLTHHRPCLRPPRVRILKKKIRREAGVYHRAGRKLICPATRTAQRQGKVARFSYDGSVPFMPRIHAVYIAVQAARGKLVAAMPGVPPGFQRVFTLHFRFTIYRFIILLFPLFFSKIRVIRAGLSRARPSRAACHGSQAPSRPKAPSEAWRSPAR